MKHTVYLLIIFYGQVNHYFEISIHLLAVGSQKSNPLKQWQVHVNNRVTLAYFPADGIGNLYQYHIFKLYQVE